MSPGNVAEQMRKASLPSLPEVRVLTPSRRGSRKAVWSASATQAQSSAFNTYCGELGRELLFRTELGRDRDSGREMGSRFTDAFEGNLDGRLDKADRREEGRPPAPPQLKLALLEEGLGIPLGGAPLQLLTCEDGRH